MIHSLFLINTSGDVFLEKHWKSVISRSVVDYFFDAQNKAANSQDIPPVIATPHHYLISSSWTRLCRGGSGEEGYVPTAYLQWLT